MLNFLFKQYIIIELKIYSAHERDDFELINFAN